MSAAPEQEPTDQPQPFIPRKKRIPYTQMDMAQRLDYVVSAYRMNFSLKLFYFSWKLLAT